MIQEAKTRFKNNGRVHDRIVCGDSAIAHLLPQLDYDMDGALLTGGRYSEWCDHKNGKVSYSGAKRNWSSLL
jgi:coenzyme F420-reducing hydrogenase delta subunit